jgi:hypothetical protein
MPVGRVHISPRSCDQVPVNDNREETMRPGPIMVMARIAGASIHLGRAIRTRVIRFVRPGSFESKVTP